jgi:uncharacterized membrane protein
MRSRKKTFRADFRQFFVRGLAVLLPSVLTLWILWQAFAFVFKNVAEPLNAGIRAAVVAVTPLVVPERRLPAWFGVTDEEVTEHRATLPTSALRNRPEETLRAEVRRAKFRAYWEEHWYLSATGLIVAIVAIYLAGVLLGGLIGRRIYSRLERFIARIPGFKQVYPHVKQLVDMVMGDKPLAFKRCVLVQYPRKGIWTLGFVTGSAMRSISEEAGGECLSVFIPSTPTPFTGFTITVPAADLVDIPISMDEAVRFVLTGGVLVPERQAIGPIEIATALSAATGRPTGRAEPPHGAEGKA